jgi:hypothetical protein
MARTAPWNRSGSPIGQGRRTRNTSVGHESPGPRDELTELKTLAKQNTPTGVLSLKLQRPPAAIRSKAQREGISLSPANRSPYSRRKAS